MFERVVRRPVATWMIAIAAAVFGLVSYERLPLNLMPDLSYPTITVRTEIAGYAPEEVEAQVSRRIEEALATTPGLVELESRSRAGMSDVILEFAWGTDMNKSSQSIREQLQTTFLPDDAERPLILRFDPNLDPIMRVALSGTDSASPQNQLQAMRTTAERQIKRRLEAMDGVASVRVRGGLSPEIKIDVLEGWMTARGITIDQVASALAAENVNLPGGAILEGDYEYLVRTVGELTTVEDIQAIQIKRADGVVVPLTELATISEGQKDREVVSRLDGAEAVELEIYKSADANIVQLSRKIRARLGVDRPERADDWDAPATIADRLPDGMKMAVLEDQANFIEASINNLRSTALLGAVLAVSILFMFLRDIRATLIIATAIPLSIIATFAPLYLGGVSLNLMSLGGLALGIGMLVDNAIVVLENIHVQRERGLDRIEAAITGTQTVAAAVVASTLTTVCVFLPIAFVEGVAGQLFGDLAMAVVFSLLASLVVALFFVPMLAAHELNWTNDQEPQFFALSRSGRFESVRRFRDDWSAAAWWFKPYVAARCVIRLGLELTAVAGLLAATAVARPAMWLFHRVMRRIHERADAAAGRFQHRYDRLDAWYGKAIDAVLRKPGQVLGTAAVIVAVSLPLFGTLGQSLIPEMHQGRFTAEVSLPVGTPLSRTVDRVMAAEKALTGDPDIVHIHTVVGTERRADSRSDEGEHTARLMIEVTGGTGIEARERAVMDRVRSALAADEGEPMTVRMVRPSLFSFRTPIEVLLYDTDLRRLQQSADTVVGELRSVAGLTDVRSSLSEGYPEVRIDYDRTLLTRFNLSTAGVAQSVRDKVLGTTATSMSRDDGRVDLTVRLDPSQRRGVDMLRRLNVNPALTPPIPLESVAAFSEEVGPSEIRRIDQRRAVVVSANMDGFDLSGMSETIGSRIQRLAVDSQAEMGGQNREMQRSLGSMQFALMLALFLVYVIMASTFESILHPFVILLSVPLALVGVGAGLLITQTAVSVVVLIGAIVLCGVVVNNAIVLVDTVNQHRLDGMNRLDAVKAGAQLRLRPILITTLTTVLGLLPLALGFGEGGEIQRPLALTIIAGLSSATVLTLGVIPVVYLSLTRALER
ncbi:MAG: efflux RND transporter permease subunit [Myxococcota bacterium]|nr:efflux RND transporter permease subunit [Myxococcota bacterium]